MPAGEWRGPQRREFSAADPELMRWVIGQVYGGVALTTRNRNGTTGFALTHVDAGSFTANSVTLPGVLAFRVRDEGAALVTTVIQGTVRAEWAKDTEGYQAGDVYLRNIPQAEFRAQTHDVRSRSIILPVSLLHAVADAECTPPGPLRFLSTRPGPGRAAVCPELDRPGSQAGRDHRHQRRHRAHHSMDVEANQRTGTCRASAPRAGMGAGTIPRLPGVPGGPHHRADLRPGRGLPHPHRRERNIKHRYHEVPLLTD